MKKDDSYKETDRSIRSHISSKDTDICVPCTFVVGLWKSIAPYLVLSTGVFATACTFIASWSCNTFYGAEVPFGGGGYGIWSLEDSEQHCQLWSVLFFTYKLDAPLQAARSLSMTAMLASLAAIAILSQIVLWGRIAAWMVAIALIYWLADSIAYWWRFNVWSTFFVVTYLWIVLLTKCVLLVHYSPTTLWIMARRLMLVCGAGASGIFCILLSDVCTCDTLLTNDDLATNLNHNTDTYSTLVTSGALYTQTEECSGKCVLGARSPAAIASPCLWFLGWILMRLVSLESCKSPEVHSSSKLDTTATFGQSEEEGEVEDDDYLEDEKKDLQEEELDNEPSDDVDGIECVLAQSETIRPTIKVSYEVDIAVLTVDKVDHSGSISRDAGIPNDIATGLDQDENKFLESMSLKRKPTCWRRFEQACFIVVSLAEVAVVALLIGSYIENKQAATAPDTSSYFVTDEVCAFDESGVFETFESPQQAQMEGFTVAHCGACGQCSNPSDIELYVETRTTVADKAKKCSIDAMFGSDEELLKCLESEIGFTRPCTTCWAENMRNTAKECMWTCLSSTLTGIVGSDTIEDAHDYEWLNQCVFCDEKRSGPAFVECSGVARRRLGIPSEFKRDPLELCTTVEVDYLSDNWTHIFLQDQQFLD